MRKPVFRYTLNISFKFKIFFVAIFACILNFSVANSENTHYFLLSNTSNIIEQSIRTDSEERQESPLTHAACSTHGHGHCCHHIINDTVGVYPPQVHINGKDSISSKNWLPTGFIRDFLRPPII